MLRYEIKKKLKSEQGTSIFFGLLLFLAASILSVVIINGAVTTVKRVASDKKTEQNYLACSSAAKLLQEKIENTVITKTTVITEKKQGDSSENSKTAVTWSDGVDATDSKEVYFENLVLGYVQKLADLSNEATVRKGTVNWDIEVKKAGTSTETTIPKVTAVCTMSPSSDSNTPKPGLDFSVLIKCDDGVNSCQMLLSVAGQYTKGSTSGKNDANEDITTIVEKYQWSGAVITSGDKKGSVGTK